MTFGTRSYLVLVVCFFFFGCASSIIELQYPCKTISLKRGYKLYVGDFLDTRPAEEQRFNFSDNIKANPAFIPLPGFAFDPCPPAEFLKQNITRQLEGAFEIVTTPDSADFCISGDLVHFSIFRSPSDAVRLSQRVTICSGIAAELSILYLAFKKSDMMGVGAVCLAPAFIFSIFASKSTIKYDTRVSVNLEIKTAGVDSLVTREIVYENSFTLSAKKNIDNKEQSNILITKAIDGICSYVVEEIK